MGEDSKSRGEPPPKIELRISHVEPGSIGIWSKLAVSAGERFGPFEGERVQEAHADMNPSFVWEIVDLETKEHLWYIDATDPERGNWMRNIKCARFLEEQNILSVQEGTDIYYRAMKDIPAGEELLTWYERVRLKKGRKRRKNPTPTLSKQYKKSGRRDANSDDTDSCSLATDDTYVPSKTTKRAVSRELSQNSTTSLSEEENPDRHEEKVERLLGAGMGMKGTNPIEENGVTVKRDHNECDQDGFFHFEIKEQHIIRNRLGRKVFLCDICSCLYKHSFSLKRHYIKHHINHLYVTEADLVNCHITKHCVVVPQGQPSRAPKNARVQQLPEDNVESTGYAQSLVNATLPGDAVCSSPRVSDGGRVSVREGGLSKDSDMREVSSDGVSSHLSKEVLSNSSDTRVTESLPRCTDNCVESRENKGVEGYVCSTEVYARKGDVCADICKFPKSPAQLYNETPTPSSSLSQFSEDISTKNSSPNSGETEDGSQFLRLANVTHNSGSKLDSGSPNTYPLNEDIGGECDTQMSKSGTPQSETPETTKEIQVSAGKTDSVSSKENVSPVPNEEHDQRSTELQKEKRRQEPLNENMAEDTKSVVLTSTTECVKENVLEIAEANCESKPLGCKGAGFEDKFENEDNVSIGVMDQSVSEGQSKEPSSGSIRSETNRESKTHKACDDSENQHTALGNCVDSEINEDNKTEYQERKGGDKIEDQNGAEGCDYSKEKETETSWLMSEQDLCSGNIEKPVVVPGSFSGQSENEELSQKEVTDNEVETKTSTTGERPSVAMPGLYRCHTCNATFDDVTGVRAHIKHHPEDANTARLLSCDQCDMTFTEKKNLMRHQVSHNSTGTSKQQQRQCKFCAKHFSNAKALRRHERSHGGWQRQTCEHCATSFSQGCDLRKHIRRAHPTCFHECAFCALYFSSKKLLVEHLATAHDKKLQDNKDELASRKDHIAAIDPVLDKAESMRLAGKKNNGKDEDAFKYACTICKKRFQDYTNMCRHRRLAHLRHLMDTVKTSEKRNMRILESTSIIRTRSAVEREMVDFYACVSDNIQDNLTNHMMGTKAMVESASSLIKWDLHSTSGTSFHVKKEPGSTPKASVVSSLLSKCNFPKSFRLKDPDGRFKEVNSRKTKHQSYSLLRDKGEDFVPSEEVELGCRPPCTINHFHDLVTLPKPIHLPSFSPAAKDKIAQQSAKESDFKTCAVCKITYNETKEYREHMREKHGVHTSEIEKEIANEKNSASQKDDEAGSKPRKPDINIPVTLQHEKPEQEETLDLSGAPAVTSSPVRAGPSGAVKGHIDNLGLVTLAAGKVGMKVPKNVCTEDPSEKLHRYLCKACHKEFSDWPQFVEHHNAQHPTIERGFSIIDPSLKQVYTHVSNSVGLLNVCSSHISAFEPKQVCHCTKCHKRFKTMPDLHKHMLACADPESLRPKYVWVYQYRKQKYSKMKRKRTCEWQKNIGTPKKSLAMESDTNGSAANGPSSDISASEKPIPTQQNDSLDTSQDGFEDGKRRRRKPFEVTYNPTRHTRRREMTEIVDTSICGGCGEDFKTISLLERHIPVCSHKEKIRELEFLKSVHETENSDSDSSDDYDPSKHLCIYCLRQFTYLGSLRNHIFDICAVRKEFVKKNEYLDDEWEQDLIEKTGGKRESLSRHSSVSSLTNLDDENSKDSTELKKVLDKRQRRRRRGFGWAHKNKPNAYNRTIKHVVSEDGFIYEYYVESEVPIISFDLSDTFILDVDKDKDDGKQGLQGRTKKTLSSPVKQDCAPVAVTSPPFVPRPPSFAHTDEVQAEDLSRSRKASDAKPAKVTSSPVRRITSTKRGAVKVKNGANLVKSQSSGRRTRRAELITDFLKSKKTGKTAKPKTITEKGTKSKTLVKTAATFNKRKGTMLTGKSSKPNMPSKKRVIASEKAADRRTVALKHGKQTTRTASPQTRRGRTDAKAVLAKCVRKKIAQKKIVSGVKSKASSRPAGACKPGSNKVMSSKTKKVSNNVLKQKVASDNPRMANKTEVVNSVVVDGVILEKKVKSSTEGKKKSNILPKKNSVKSSLSKAIAFSISTKERSRKRARPLQLKNIVRNKQKNASLNGALAMKKGPKLVKIDKEQAELSENHAPELSPRDDAKGCEEMPLASSQEKTVADDAKNTLVPDADETGAVRVVKSQKGQSTETSKIPSQRKTPKGIRLKKSSSTAVPKVQQASEEIGLVGEITPRDKGIQSHAENGKLDTGVVEKSRSHAGSVNTPKRKEKHSARRDSKKLEKKIKQGKLKRKKVVKKTIAAEILPRKKPRKIKSRDVQVNVLSESQNLEKPVGKGQGEVMKMQLNSTAAVENAEQSSFVPGISQDSNGSDFAPVCLEGVSEEALTSESMPINGGGSFDIDYFRYDGDKSPGSNERLSSKPVDGEKEESVPNYNHTIVSTDKEKKPKRKKKEEKGSLKKEKKLIQNSKEKREKVRKKRSSVPVDVPPATCDHDLVLDTVADDHMHLLLTPPRKPQQGWSTKASLQTMLSAWNEAALECSLKQCSKSKTKKSGKRHTKHRDVEPTVLPKSGSVPDPPSNGSVPDPPSSGVVMEGEEKKPRKRKAITYEEWPDEFLFDDVVGNGKKKLPVKRKKTWRKKKTKQDHEMGDLVDINLQKKSTDVAKPVKRRRKKPKQIDSGDLTRKLQNNSGDAADIQPAFSKKKQEQSPNAAEAKTNMSNDGAVQKTGEKSPLKRLQKSSNASPVRKAKSVNSTTRKPNGGGQSTFNGCLSVACVGEKMENLPNDEIKQSPVRPLKAENIFDAMDSIHNGGFHRPSLSPVSEKSAINTVDISISSRVARALKSPTKQTVAPVNTNVSNNNSFLSDSIDLVTNTVCKAITDSQRPVAIVRNKSPGRKTPGKCQLNSSTNAGNGNGQRKAPRDVYEFTDDERSCSEFEVVMDNVDSGDYSDATEPYDDYDDVADHATRLSEVESMGPDLEPSS